MKILHIIGGASKDGAYKGANILHKELLRLKIDSKILNDTQIKNDKKIIRNLDDKVIYINKDIIKYIINKFFVYIEKFLKSIFLHSPRSTFTLGFFGFDITRIKEFKEADIIHIHWIGQGFIKLNSLSKIDKPVVWTMRDMWPFTGGSHYSMDFEKFENSNLSKKIQKIKKGIYKKNFTFIAISDWLKNKAKKSYVLEKYDIERIYNNIDLKDFNLMEKKYAEGLLKISTNKKIILYGAQNTQSKRKGWEIFVNTLKKLDKNKYFLLVFGNLWSQKTLDDIGIEYKSLGFIDDNKILNAAYSIADLFVASSIQEAFGKTWAEALACGTPVLCFNDTSISEIIDHKINGYITNNFDSDELHGGITWLSEKLVKNDTIKKEIINKALKFDVKIIAENYINLYKKLLAEK